MFEQGLVREVLMLMQNTKYRIQKSEDCRLKTADCPSHPFHYLRVALAAPAFTLSSSSETRTVNTSATGFTISSTGGAIASFAISATPAGMSFSTSTGALTGTPNTVASATAYTITATNATGSTTRIFTLTVNDDAPDFNISSSTETDTVNKDET